MVIFREPSGSYCNNLASSVPHTICFPLGDQHNAVKALLGIVVVMAPVFVLMITALLLVNKTARRSVFSPGFGRRSRMSTGSRRRVL